MVIEVINRLAQLSFKRCRFDKNKNAFLHESIILNKVCRSMKQVYYKRCIKVICHLECHISLCACLVLFMLRESINMVAPSTFVLSN